jgi:hypothetical protein
MRLRRLFTNMSLLGALALGIIGGLSLALASDPASAAGLQVDRAIVISYRGNDNIPPEAELTGWDAPMFYTTPDQGGPPPGSNPTGPWAPGDTRERSLMIRNVDPDFQVKIAGLEVKLTGDLALAGWYTVQVKNAAQTTIFNGTLTELAAQFHSLTQGLLLNPGQLETLTFTVHLDLNTDQRLQGRTVRADILIHASAEGYATGKVTGGVNSGRHKGGFVIMRKQGDSVPTGQLEFQDHAQRLNFHADQYTDLLVSLDRTKSWFSGSGTLDGVSGYTFDARAYDLGEPGRDDQFEITIYDAAGNQVYGSGNLIGLGNIQIHTK